MKGDKYQAGASIIEMVMVIVIVSGLTAITVISLNSGRKYAPDDQAKKIVDALDEARQKSLNQRQTFRVEINRTRGQIILIDENRPGDATDDRILKRQTLSGDVSIAQTPTNIAAGPVMSSPVPVPTYASNNYPLSNGEEKITFRFLRNGLVTDAGTDNIGTGSIVTGATIYVTSRTPSVTQPELIRAVTILGTSGDTSIFKCSFTSGVCGNWNR